jgi:cystathionine beta-lyase
MRYDFDTPVDRRNTSCLKWDYLDSMFGRDDLISMWIADMDFRLPEPVLDRIRERAGHGVFGYTARPRSFYEAVRSWFRRRYGMEVPEEWITATPGVVPAFCFAMQEFTSPGDGVIIQPPVYHPFEESIRINGRKTVENPLVFRGGRYTVDLRDLSRKAADAGMLVICSPHNPVSRVWTEDELLGMMEIAEEHDLLVFSDEIHADIVFKPHRHIPTLTVGEKTRRRTIAAYATSKTFNLAGLQLSVILIADPEVRKRYTGFIEKLQLAHSNIFGIVATQAAYESGEEWLDQLLGYLWGNYVFVRDFTRDHLPGIRVQEPEGTFLLWLDCRGTGMKDDELKDFFIHEAGVCMNHGSMFGTGGHGCMRMNIATPRSNLRAALESISEAMGRRSER